MLIQKGALVFKFDKKIQNCLSISKRIENKSKKGDQGIQTYFLKTKLKKRFYDNKFVEAGIGLINYRIK